MASYDEEVSKFEIGIGIEAPRIQHFDSRVDIGQEGRRHNISGVAEGLVKDLGEPSFRTTITVRLEFSSVPDGRGAGISVYTNAIAL
jgi:hypothetical protein